MTIQSLGNYCQIPNTVKADFQNFNQNFGNLINALKSGNQDQVSLSGNALLQAMNQVQTDWTQSQQTGNTNSTQNSTREDFRNLLGAVNAAAMAITSGNQDQINASQSTLQQMTTQFQNDLTTIQGTNTSSQNQTSTQNDFQNLLSAINNLLSAQQSGSQDQINTANDAMQKAITQLQTDVPALQQTRGHHHHNHQVNTNNNGNSNNSYNNTGNNNPFSFLAALTGYGNIGSSQTASNVGSVNLTA